MTDVSLGDLGRVVAGEVCGEPSLVVRCALPLEAKLPAQCLTLADSAKLFEQLHASNAAAAVVPLDFPQSPLPLLRVANPRMAFEQIIETLRPQRVTMQHGVHIGAFVDSTARLGQRTSIGAGSSIAESVVVGADVRIHRGVHVMADCVIGDGCELYPGVVLYPGTRLGRRCTLHAGCVLGANGFGYRTVAGKHLPAAQLGWVEVGDDVEMGACVTVDRGSYGPTRIGTGTKIDNQVMIGHNCQIGEHNLLCAQVGIAGSTTTGNHVVMAGQVGIKDHLRIGDKVVIAAQSGVMHDLPGPGVWCGSPAAPLKEHMKSVALQSRMSDMRDEVRELQREVAQLRELLSQAPMSVTQTKAA